RCRSRFPSGLRRWRLWWRTLRSAARLVNKSMDTQQTEKPASTAAPSGSPVLSIRQPWAWLICNGGKDIENRNWRTLYRGHVFIHAGKGMTRDEYEIAHSSAEQNGVTLPSFA